MKKEYAIEFTETSTLIFSMEEKELKKYIKEFDSAKLIDEIKNIAKHHDRDGTDINHLQEHVVEVTKSLWK